MNDVQFRRQVDEALKKVARVLDNTRTPVYPADCQHTYDDKYGLAEFLGNVTVASLLNVLELLGVTDEHFARLYEWAQQRTITLGFSAEQSCTFVRKAKRREQSPTELVTTTTFLGISTKSTSKSTYTIKERFWSFKASWQLFAYRGTAADERIVLAAHQGAAELVTSGTKHAPQSSGSVAYHEADVSWLFRQSSDQRVMRFAIDRSLPSCHTPRRNNAVAAALSATDALVLWTGNVRRYFESHLFPIQPQGKSSYPLAQIEPSTLFVPVVPLLDDSLLDPAPSSSSAASSSSSSSVAFTLTSNGGVVLSLADANQFLNEQRRSIVEKFAELDKSFPQDGELIQAAETHVVLLCKQAERVCQAFRSGVDVIEAMLYNQLVAAIGKEVTPVDFAAYMRFHNRKLFHKQFEPRPFCYAVRRPEHFPEGTLSIESTGDDGPQPITTIVRQIEPARPMNFAIDASTRVTFNGQRYLHAWMGHTFQGHSPAELTLVARARQFSSFVLMIGRVASATVFEPVAAVIVQNKDELRVALNLEQIPAPRDFAEAIRSLSPEQQAFCKAYRQMQLESTLFGLLVVQIKPQLEKLLRIPDDALTKEIRLTQDLLELFIKYQIPSDLLTYDGADAASLRTKIDAVRGYVANMNQMIAARRSAELSSTVQTAVYRALADEPSIRAGANFSPAERRVLTAGRGRTTATSGQSATSDGAYADDDDDDDPSLFDFTAVPHLLDARMARIDVDGALSPTIISASPGAWTRRSQASLMSDPVTSTLGDQDKAVEKSKAFDLLDALSRSGALEVDHCELHVVIAAMHRFDHSLMQTVVEDNINPIDKVERSTLLIAELVHDTDVASLIKADHLQRVQATSPVLFQQ